VDQQEVIRNALNIGVEAAVEAACEICLRIETDGVRVADYIRDAGDSLGSDYWGSYFYRPEEGIDFDGLVADYELWLEDTLKSEAAWEARAKAEGRWLPEWDSKKETE
jgi:hypothetical protein